MKLQCLGLPGNGMLLHVPSYQHWARYTQTSTTCGRKGKAPREVQTQQSSPQALNEVSLEHFLLGLGVYFKLHLHTMMGPFQFPYGSRHRWALIIPCNSEAKPQGTQAVTMKFIRANKTKLLSIAQTVLAVTNVSATRLKSSSLELLKLWPTWCSGWMCQKLLHKKRERLRGLVHSRTSVCDWCVKIALYNELDLTIQGLSWQKPAIFIGELVELLIELVSSGNTYRLGFPWIVVMESSNESEITAQGFLMPRILQDGQGANVGFHGDSMGIS